MGGGGGVAPGVVGEQRARVKGPFETKPFPLPGFTVHTFLFSCAMGCMK